MSEYSSAWKLCSFSVFWFTKHCVVGQWTESTAGLTQETLQKPNNRNHLNQEHINHICDPGAQNQS